VSFHHELTGKNTHLYVSVQTAGSGQWFFPCMLLVSTTEMNAANPVMMRRFILSCNIERLTRVLKSPNFSGNRHYLRSLVHHYRQQLALFDAGEYGAFGELGQELSAKCDGSCVGADELEIDGIDTDLPTIILDPGPGLKILFANEAFKTETGLSNGRLVGRPVFDVFPENPESSESECISHTFNSINQMTSLKEPQILTHQRYDIGNCDGVFAECYWRMEFRPLLCANEQVKFIEIVVVKLH
jgi:hypothetical protein